MPIGGQNAPIDAAPEPIRLDQVSVDKAIAGFIQEDEVLDDQKSEPKNPETNKTTAATGNTPTVKGALKTKTYALKKNVNNKRRSFKCSECKEVKKSIKELNIHHRESHNPQNIWAFAIGHSNLHLV